MHIFNQDIEFVEEHRSCSYFDEKHRILGTNTYILVQLNNIKKMLERGWRRFGRMHFVPECKKKKENVFQ